MCQALRKRTTTKEIVSALKTPNLVKLKRKVYKIPLICYFHGIMRQHCHDFEFSVLEDSFLWLKDLSLARLQTKASTLEEQHTLFSPHNLRESELHESSGNLKKDERKCRAGN